MENVGSACSFPRYLTKAPNVVGWQLLSMAGRKTPTLNISIGCSGFRQPPEIEPTSHPRLDYYCFFQEVYFLWVKYRFSLFLSMHFGQGSKCGRLVVAEHGTPTLNSSIEGSAFCQPLEIQPASQPRHDYY